jgi:membrane-bound lytic murein transglycosylase D
MPDTAKRFGLRNDVYDERFSPYKSGRAAAQYLKVLHREFGSWDLALAAYNAGEGRVGRLLRRYHAETFGEIAAYLPRETRSYVSKVLHTIAARDSS